MDQPVSHADHRTPLDRRVGLSKFLGHHLGRFTDDLEAPDKCAPQRFIRREILEREARALLDKLVGFDEDVAEVVTRLEGHPQPLPGSAVR